MPHDHRPTMAIALTFVAAIGLIVGLWIALESQRPEPQTTRSAPTDALADPSASPIWTAEEALEKSRSLWPTRAIAAETAVRLVSRTTVALHWTQEFDPEGHPYVDWMPEAPLWMVGMRTTGMSVGQVLRMPAGVGVDDPRPAAGGFMIWDANSGELVTSGALMPGTIYTFEALASLANEPMTIVRATIPPTPFIP